MSSPLPPPDFLALSATIGRDPNRVQGAGGNTSIKLGDTLMIKASGTWLADALERPIFLTLALAPLCYGLAAGKPFEACVRPVGDPAGLRPSIETALHALMPHTVVVHTHSIDAIAIAISRDGEVASAEALAGLRHAWIPYAKPGAPLSDAMRAIAPEAPDVLVLANHGLVVGAGSCASAAALLGEVEARLASFAPKFPAPDRTPAPIDAPAGWAPARLPEIHRLAYLDGAAAACAAPLYPDHVVFLGPGPVPIVEASALTAALAAMPHVRLVVVRGAGALMRDNASAGEIEMARCIALVAERLNSRSLPVYLSEASQLELAGWESEAFRQALDHARSAQMTG